MMADLPDYDLDDDSDENNDHLTSKSIKSKNKATKAPTEITEQNAEDLLKMFNR